MKNIIIFFFFAAFVLFSEACNSGVKNSKTNTDMQSSNNEVYYTCTMHPEVHYDKQGKCPKCGMELVKKERTISDSVQLQNHEHPGNKIK